jgi:prefoldin subunit 5
MKSFYLIALMLGTAAILHAQATEGTVSFKKNNQSAAVIELPFSADIVNASLNEYLSKKGRSKETDARGFTTFRNTQSLQGDSVNADLFFKVERKDKQSSITSLLVTLEVSQTTTGSGINNLSMEEAKAYLNNLVPIIESYQLELLIKDQNEAIIKAESKYKSIANDGDDLNKKKLNIEKDIDDNRKELQKLSNETDQQKQKLAELVRQRKSI